MSIKAMNALDRKIRDTEQEIERLKHSDTSFPQLRDAMLSEICRRLDDLHEDKRQLIEAAHKETVSLRLHGKDIETGKISNRLLIEVLSGFQSLADAAADAVVNETPSRFGKFKRKVLENTDFKVLAFFEGSFGVTLEKESEPNLGDSVASNTLSDIFSVIECGQNTDRLSDYIAPFGLRFTRNYRDLLCSLKSNSVDLEINWTDHNAELQRYDIENDKIDEIITYLDDVKDIRDQTVMKSGKLTMINIRSNRFEFESESDGILRGASRFETLIRARETVGSPISATFIKSDHYSVGEIYRKTTWFLSNINF